MLSRSQYVDLEFGNMGPCLKGEGDRTEGTVGGRGRACIPHKRLRHSEALCSIQDKMTGGKEKEQGEEF